MKRNCPITGDIAEITETVDRVIVEHPKFGRYVLDTNAPSALETNAGARTRMARWIAESRSSDIDVPNVTAEHVHFFERLVDLEAAISEWHKQRQGIQSDDEERLWKKLRLEWNYNSNHIEGNTLTYHETELLLIHGRTAGGHPMRDYEEMKAHDVAIDHARFLAREERSLGEGDIRDLNKTLLKEPFWQNAETPDGQPTRKRIIPGQYKTQPNHVRTATGELYRFAEPGETPALMEQWTRDFRRDLERSAYPLPLFLAESHWSFLRIHPFDDGNGRTARLLANYALLRNNLPPIVIKSDDRDRYISGLQNADVGRMLPLAQFMLENVSWSIALAIRAAKGESIRAPDDMVKEMELFVRSKEAPEPHKSDLEVLDNVFVTHVCPVLERLDSRLEPLSKLFRCYSAISYIAKAQQTVNSSSLFEIGNWDRTKQSHIVVPGFNLSDKQYLSLQRKYSFQDYTGRGDSSFDLILHVAWRLEGKGFSFEVSINGPHISDISHRIAYSALNDRDAEVDQTVEAICRRMMDEIDSRSQGPK